MSDATPVGAVHSAAGADDAVDQPAPRRPLDSSLTGAVAAIWLRELRGRMRGKRAFIFITIYLMFLAGLLYAGLRGTLEVPTIGALEQAGIGRGIFTAVILLETLVAVALAPAYTAGSISQEREKLTFDLLAVTPVSSIAIVLGKLLSGLSYLALVIAASIPLASIAFLFGGLGVETVLQAYVVLAVITVGVGSIGVACSAVMRRTQPATVASFVITGALVLGGTAAWVLLTERVRFEGGTRPPEALLYLNPFFAEADVLCENTNNVCIPGITMPSDPIGQRFDDFGNPLPPLPEDIAPAAEGPTRGALWPKAIGSWLLVGGVSLLIASQAISPSRRWRPWHRATRPTEPER